MVAGQSLVKTATTPPSRPPARRRDVDPGVLVLAQTLAAPRIAHLTKPHQRDYIRALARTIQVSINDFFLPSLPDDRDWPIPRDGGA